MAGTAKRVTYNTTDPAYHDSKNIALQKINQIYCACTPTPGPDGPGTVLDLLVYWKMEENAITRQDSHVGNHDLLDDGAVPTPSTASGIILNAADFGGGVDPDKYLSNSESVFDLQGEMTISTWVYLNDTGAPDRFIMGKWFGLSSLLDSAGYCIIFGGGRFSFVHAYSAFYGRVDSGVSVSAGQWYHVVCGRTGLSTIFIQVNNEARQFGTGFAPPSPAEPFRVGGVGGIFYPVNGRIDETGVWLDRALTTDYVTYLYNGGAGRTYPFV